MTDEKQMTADELMQHAHSYFVDLRTARSAERVELWKEFKAEVMSALVAAEARGAEREREAGDGIPLHVLDLVRWLAGCCMLQQRKRHEAIGLKPEECREFVMMKWPIVQGMRNQMALEKIGRQSINKENLAKAVEWLLASAPESATAPGPHGEE